MGLSFPQGSGVPFHLRARDSATGKELWSRFFTGVPPIAFADPQGDRLVLSWKAKSAGAWAAAKREPVLKDALKKAKLTDHDSFLEALDARTGKSVGGVLVQSGTGPANFDSIFSCGQSIIFSRDAVLEAMGMPPIPGRPARSARAGLAKRLEKIVLTPNGDKEVASANCNLFGLGSYGGAGGAACTVLPKANFLVKVAA